MSGSTTEAADAPETSVHNNTVTIDDSTSKTISSISHVPNSLVISKGQPAGTPDVVENDNVFKINLQAGRHKTDSVADAFNNACGGSGKEFSPVSEGNSTPDELSFCFAVTLQFNNGASVEVYLGQGSVGLTNNWWIGGNSIFNSDGTVNLEYDVDNTLYSTPLYGTQDSFALGKTMSNTAK